MAPMSLTDRCQSMLAVTLKWIFVVLHITTAAAWFGLGLIIARHGKAALSADAPARPTVLSLGSRIVRLMTIMIVLTLVFSWGSFFAGGAFPAYGPQYHISFTLIVVLVAVHFFLIRAPWNRLTAALTDSAGGAGTHAKRISMGVGIGHLLWLVILVLMFWTELSGALGLV